MVRVAHSGAALPQEALVLVTRGPIQPDEWTLMTEARVRGARILLMPLRGIAPRDRAGLRALRPVLVWLSGSTPPPDWRNLGPVVSAPTSGFRAAEDALIASWLGVSRRVGPGGVIVAGKGATAMKALDAVARDLKSIAPPVANGASISLLLSDFSTAPHDWALPSLWVRSALRQGAPFAAAEHPSIVDLTAYGVMDSPRRAAALYSQAPERMLVAADAGRREVVAQTHPAEQCRHWSSLLCDPQDVPTRSDPRPTLLALFDLAQDFDVLLPTLERLRARGRLDLRIVVTDWLREESPRTLRGLAKAGFHIEVLSRSDVRKGLAPDLERVAGVLAATETSVGPHRAGHALAGQAASRGLPSFTVQHGLANIGLTYRDDTHGAEVRFASDTVFIWGEVEALPDWVCAETRQKAVPVGDMRAGIAPVAAPGLPRGDWDRLVGVFENLHWGRYDEAYRTRFLQDLADTAKACPRTLFLIKPHHAARWAEKNRTRIPDLPNIRLVETQDPIWQAFTAPALIAGLDRVITTPSTVAVDAARAGAPVAVAAYDLTDMETFEPLPMLRSAHDWIAFCRGDGAPPALLGDIFLGRAITPGSAPDRIAQAIETRLIKAAAG